MRLIILWFLYKIVIFNKNNNIFFKSFFFNYFLINFIILNNLIKLGNLIYSNFFKKKIIFLICKKPLRYKFMWNTKNRFFIKIKFNFYKKKNNFFYFRKKKPINKIIKLKRLSGLFKKRIHTRISVLNRRASLFRFFFNKKKKFFRKKKFRDYRVNNLDLSIKKKLIFFENRKIIRVFLKKKNLKRQNKLNSYLVGFLSKKTKFLLNWFEFRLNIILIKSHFFNNLVDSNFFIKNGFVLVNGSANYDINYNIKINDIIKILNKKYYYNLYKTSLNDSIFSLKKLNWAYYKLKKKNRKKTFFPKVYNWIYKYNHFGFDVPYYMELDYINLTLFILEKPLNTDLINYNSLKYLNLYLTRLYNWNYIV